MKSLSREKRRWDIDISARWKICLQPRSDGSDSVMDWCVLCLSLCMINADDPAGWAGLMAVCHTENTACLLQGSAPRREGLERAHMTLVSEKGQWDLRMSCQCICIYADGSMALKLCVLCIRSVLSEGPAGRGRALGSGSGGMGAAAGCDWTQTEWPIWPGRDSLLPGTHTHAFSFYVMLSPTDASLLCESGTGADTDRLTCSWVSKQNRVPVSCADMAPSV